MAKIKLGYKVGTSEEVFIKPSHMIVTGVTQLSGKTTTLEALLARQDQNVKAIVFKTKPGERSFSDGDIIPPFFRDRSDYEFVRSLIEAYNREKLGIEKGTLMTVCKGTNSLLEIKKKVDEAMASGKLRGINLEINTRLQHYLDMLIPQIQAAQLSRTLDLLPGINIMNLERFSVEAQSLIIQAVAGEVLKNLNNTILVIPEAWKFLPQKYNNPCKRTVEEYIRQGAANQNFVWVDSQDMAGVDKSPLKQISVWVLGYQSEINEVKHTLAQIPLPAKLKPKEEHIMNLKIGQFFVSTGENVTKVYVQPSWMDDKTAISISKGQAQASDFKAPLTFKKSKFRIPVASDPTPGPGNDQVAQLRKEINEVRIDFHNKIDELVDSVQESYDKIQRSLGLSENFNKPELPNIDNIVTLVLQKMPLQKKVTAEVPVQAIDVKSLIPEILKHLPAGGGAAVYQVAPLEKIRQNFLQEIRDKILADIKSLTDRQRKILRFVEASGQGCNISHIIEKLFMQSATSSGTRNWVSKENSILSSLNLSRKDKNGSLFPLLKERIKELMGNHGAKETEIDNLYNHIMAELI